MKACAQVPALACNYYIAELGRSRRARSSPTRSTGSSLSERAVTLKGALRPLAVSRAGADMRHGGGEVGKHHRHASGVACCSPTCQLWTRPAIKGFNLGTWAGLVAPAGTPPPISNWIDVLCGLGPLRCPQ
jgi:hypothetical protein